MEKIIQLLIQDDIKFERQFWILEGIGWDAETIRTHNLTVIGLLLNIEISESVIEIYSKMVERSFKWDFNQDQIKDLSKEIFGFLNLIGRD